MGPHIFSDRWCSIRPVPLPSSRPGEGPRGSERATRSPDGRDGSAVLRFVWLIVFAILVLNRATVPAATAQAATDSDRRELERLIETIKSYEEGMPNYEIRIDRELRSYKKKRELFTSRMMEDQRSIRFIRQGDWYYNQKKSRPTTLGGEKLILDSLGAYDGELTRAIEQVNFASIHEGPQSRANLFSPHTAFLYWNRAEVPLWVYLSGGKVLKNHPAAGFLYKRYYTSVRTELVGEETVDKLECWKVKVETRAPGQEEHRPFVRLVWLAKDRDLLPIRSEHFLQPPDDKFPIEVDRMTVFERIPEGFWIPKEWVVATYDEFALKEDAQANMESELYYRVTFFDPNPHYDRAFFSNIDMSSATRVTRVRDGKIIERVDRRAPASKRRSSLPLMAIRTMAIVVLGLIAGAVIWRLRRLRESAVDRVFAPNGA